jgi:hypothetical protein
MVKQKKRQLWESCVAGKAGLRVPETHDALIQALCNGLARIGDPAKAQVMRAYMKSDLPRAA